MRKKYLSALLFGALLFASAGTFTSCKDYDDDINNLQSQIDSNKDAIAALQKLVGEGKWVTSISPIENGFTVTMSDGSTTEVKGINGNDGKDGTQWSIGEDGYWYLDGEKTEHYALGTKGEDGKDGENGITAPAPFINNEGYWVVYEWDETTGQFIDKKTDVSAQGTSAYVVEKDGVYTLHIANESGIFQDITLPASADVFIIEAPASVVTVEFQYAKWNPATTNKDYQALVKKFAELANIKKDSLVKQGGNLPVLVNPASVELTDKYTYSLQTVKGETPNIVISNPVKGLPKGTAVNQWGEMTTRSTNATDCFWTLSVAPQIEDRNYVVIDNQVASLSIENELGKVSKTAFAYKVDSENKSNKNVEILPIGFANFASEIDLLAAYENENGRMVYPVTIDNGYNGYHIITLTNSYEVEKYGLSIAEDGQTLKIGNMPSDVTNIRVHLNVIALGLNGKADNKDVVLTIGQEVAATGALANQNITFSGKDQTLTWKIADLGLSAVELDKVLSGGITLTATREYINDNDQEVKATAYNGGVTFYNEKGTATKYNGNGTWTNGTAVSFGITVNAKDAAPQVGTTEYPMPERWVAPTEYTITLSSRSGNTVIYSAEATLKTALPEITDSYIRLAAGYVENGILQITGTPDDNYWGGITYNLNDALVLNGVKVIDFEDLDYDKEEKDAASTARYNWIADKSGILSVSKWITKDEINPWYAAKYNQLYTTRKLRANVYFFDNLMNKATFDFQATVKSTIYSAEPTSVITIDGTKLVSNYGGDAIKLKDAIKKAVYAAGTKKGQEYSLFYQAGGTKQEERTDVAKPVYDGLYALNSSSVPVEINREDLIMMGMSTEKYLSLKSTDKFYITQYGYNNNYELIDPTDTDQNKDITIMGWSAIVDYIFTNGIYKYENGELKAKEGITASEDLKYKKLFDTYRQLMSFGKSYMDITSDEIPLGDGLSKDAVFSFADKNEAAKYVNTSLADFTVKPLSEDELTVDPKEVKIPMYLTVKDNWGMTMKVPFNLTIKTTK